MNRVLFLGAGGTGMQGLAYLFREKGDAVLLTDDNPEFPGLSQEEAAAHLQDISLMVYTDAAPETHELRRLAREKSVRQIPYHEALGEFSRAYTTIAVTGTHGKSSTTAFLAHMCIEAGIDPTVLVGARMPSLPGGHARLGKSKYFIVEADEYRQHFLPLAPAHAIITSIDFDHPDAFTSLVDVELAYSEFLARVASGGTVAVPRHEYENHPGISWPHGTDPVELTLAAPLPGAHMAVNAGLAARIAAVIGIPQEQARVSLQTFPGLERRFEYIGTVRGCDIRSDYGHHPAELRATISGARTAYPGKRLAVLFEAHMPLRLRTFFDEFAAALSLADSIAITPPFAPAGRDESGREDARRLVNTLKNEGKDAQYVEDVDAYLSQGLSADILLFFSAGPLDSLIRKTVKKG